MLGWKKSQTPAPLPPTPPRITEKTDFPTGLAIDTEKGCWFIKGKARFKFFSERVFNSWGLETIEADFAAIKHLIPGGNLGFRDGTLINNVADGKMYLISGNKKRHIVSPDALDRFGLDPLKALLVAEDEAALHEDGEVLR